MKLKDTPLGTPEEFNVVIEIPQGSSKKYEYDEAKDEMNLDFIFTGGFHFPFNYGFIPQTLGGDGDTLDAIVLDDKGFNSGEVIACRPIGMIEMLDRGEEDHKIIAVPVDDASMANTHSIHDLPPNRLEDFRVFYEELARQKQKTIEILGFEGKDQAIRAIKKAMI